MMEVILSTAYFPNAHYFFYLLNADKIYIDDSENYQKQSYRNRARILTANGPQDLVIPVKHAKSRLITEVEISYGEKWQRNHWRAISSAYRKSAYFAYFEQEIKAFYEQEYRYLFDYNHKLLQTILKILKLNIDIQFSVQNVSSSVIDLRNIIHPKEDARKDEIAFKRIGTSYYQTFSGKFPFQPNLSILDLLFNKGLDSAPYFRLR